MKWQTSPLNNIYYVLPLLVTKLIQMKVIIDTVSIYTATEAVNGCWAFILNWWEVPATLWKLLIY